MTTNRRALLVNAIANELERQYRAAGQRGDVDVDRLALAVDLALNHQSIHPDDPEGDGLAPPELNASNDA